MLGSRILPDVKPMFSDGEMSGLEITVTCRFNVEEAAEELRAIIRAEHCRPAQRMPQLMETL